MLVPPEYFRQITHSLSPAAAAAAAAAPAKPTWSKNSFSLFGYFLCDSDEFKYLKAQDTGVDCCRSLWFWFFSLKEATCKSGEDNSDYYKRTGWQ